MHHRRHWMGAWQIFTKCQRLYHHGSFRRWLSANSRPLCCSNQLHRIIHIDGVLQRLENFPGPHRRIQTTPVLVGWLAGRADVPDFDNADRAPDKTAKECLNGCSTVDQTINIECGGVEPEMDDRRDWCGRICGRGCNNNAIELNNISAISRAFSISFSTVLHNQHDSLQYPACSPSCPFSHPASLSNYHETLGTRAKSSSS